MPERRNPKIESSEDRIHSANINLRYPDFVIPTSKVRFAVIFLKKSNFV
jgi:hypothetical protein